MTREGALLITVAFAALLISLGVLAWRRRTRRDAGLTAPVGEIPAGAATTVTLPCWYVATTRHGEPLERLAIRGLAFRSRADVTVTDQGVALDLVGQPRLFIDAGRIAGIEQATVAIDRVVERDGLVRLSWSADTGEVVDSYLRPQDVSARVLADALRTIPPTSSPSHASGSDA